MENVVALCGRQAAGSVESTIDHVNSGMISLRLRRVQYVRRLRFDDCRELGDQPPHSVSVCIRIRDH